MKGKSHVLFETVHKDQTTGRDDLLDHRDSYKKVIE